MTDTLLRNAFIYTGDARHTCFAHGALLISQGRLRWVGEESQSLAAPQARVVDLGGRVVMPGLINTHTHGGLSLHRGCCDSGNLFQWAQTLAPFTSPLTLEDNRWGCYQAVLEMVRGGVTTACDCTRYGAGLFGSVAAEVGMRSLGGALANSPSLRPNGRPNWPLALEETQQAMAEQSGDGRCRFYLGAHSPYSCTPELLVEVKQAAKRLGLPFVIHAAESQEEVAIVQSRYGRRPIEHLHHLGVLDAQTILAHGVWLDEGEIELLAETGASVSHNPISNAKLASGIAPVMALRAFSGQAHKRIRMTARPFAMGKKQVDRRDVRQRVHGKQRVLAGITVIRIALEYIFETFQRRPRVTQLIQAHTELNPNIRQARVTGERRAVMRGGAGVVPGVFPQHMRQVHHRREMPVITT